MNDGTEDIVLDDEHVCSWWDVFLIAQRWYVDIDTNGLSSVKHSFP